MDKIFDNRSAAGKALAEALMHLQGRDDLMVLALPRGGVPVAFEVAQTLDAPLDVMIVRKLGLPAQEELAMGAIASGGHRVLNEDILRFNQVSAEELEVVVNRENEELLRRQTAYRGDRLWPSLQHKTLILIDDGLATGATMRAAVMAARQQGPAQVIVAAPVAPRSTLADFQNLADEVVVLETPEPFLGVGRWYRNFDQTDDEEVRTLLKKAWRYQQSVFERARADRDVCQPVS